MFSLPVVQEKSARWDEQGTFFISGRNEGVLVFPDWSRSNPYQKLMYGALASEYDIKVKGYPANLFTRRSEEHTSELQSRGHLVCRLLLEKKKKTRKNKNADE